MMRRSRDLLTILGATLLFMPLGGYAAEADRIELNLRVNSGSASHLVPRNHKSPRRRPLTRRWWTCALVHTNGSAFSL